MKTIISYLFERAIEPTIIMERPTIIMESFTSGGAGKSYHIGLAKILYLN